MPVKGSPKIGLKVETVEALEVKIKVLVLEALFTILPVFVKFNVPVEVAEMVGPGPLRVNNRSVEAADEPV